VKEGYIISIYLLKNLKKKELLVMYGNKNPFMVVDFLAYVKNKYTNHSNDKVFYGFYVLVR
jgi:hypothetical protein